MRNYLVAAMLFWALGQLSAQQIAIPYRDGTKWGLCDRDGKMIVQPQYDSLRPTKPNLSDVSFRILTATVGTKKGLLKDGKEMLAPVYDWMYFSQDYINAEKDSGGVISKYFFDTDGHPMFAKPMLRYEVLGREFLKDNGVAYYLFVLSGTDINGLESIFTWDSRTKEVAQWLAKEVYSVKIERVKGNGYLLLRKREKQDSPVVLERYAYDKGRFYQAPEQRPLLGSDERDELPYSGSYSGGYSGGGSGSGNSQGKEYDAGDIMIDAPMADYGSGSGSRRGSTSYTPEEEKRREDEKTGRIQSVNFYKDLDGKTLAAARVINGKSKKIVFKFQPESFSVKNNKHSITVKDTVYNYSNIVVYKHKGRQGIIMALDIRKEYDTLIEFSNSKSSSYTTKAGFIAGNRDKKTKKMKYGILDANADVKAIVYDDITYEYSGFASNTADLIAVKDGKYGLLDYDGNVVVPPGYDLITPLKSIEGNRFFQIKKGALYGLYIRRRDGMAVTVLPVFSYPIKDVYLDFPNGRASGKEDNNMMLIQLMNPDGSIAGYAREDGFLYFKD